jgi:hypothetical protein
VLHATDGPAWLVWLGAGLHTCVPVRHGKHGPHHQATRTSLPPSLLELGCCGLMTARNAASSSFTCCNCCRASWPLATRVVGSDRGSATNKRLMLPVPSVSTAPVCRAYDACSSRMTKARLACLDAPSQSPASQPAHLTAQRLPRIEICRLRLHPFHEPTALTCCAACRNGVHLQCVASAGQ